MTRIESVSAQPDRAGRYAVRFNDGSVMRLYRQTVEDFGLFSGQELSEGELNELRDAAGAMSAKMRAVRIVAATNVSKRDLEQRLIHKGEDPLQAKNAVQCVAKGTGKALDNLFRTADGALRLSKNKPDTY